MGIITRERVVREVDLWNYTPDYFPCADCGARVEKHILQEEARYHVIHYDTQGPHCSEVNCEMNHKH